ncbi:hypothetical protein SORBI_3009G082050 [Sorghum bicolor]|uniref:Uncharacterized protein n=1 Tax=Sorghum bicolor TaxID=4558 RepID=A0A1Z5R1I0_SORBI|nr:hypothetical protein SORBI_3009G082050 [Sorghum bicolor]
MPSGRRYPATLLRHKIVADAPAQRLSLRHKMPDYSIQSIVPPTGKVPLLTDYHSMDIYRSPARRMPPQTHVIGMGVGHRRDYCAGETSMVQRGCSSPSSLLMIHAYLPFLLAPKQILCLMKCACQQFHIYTL